jgi:hypothetical protein
MTQPTPSPRVTKLLPRHTEAGIEIQYDDHCVRLVHDGEPLVINPDTEYEVLAVWMTDVSFERMVNIADAWLMQEEVSNVSISGYTLQ